MEEPKKTSGNLQVISSAKNNETSRAGPEKVVDGMANAVKMHHTVPAQVLETMLEKLGRDTKVAGIVSNLASNSMKYPKILKL